MTEMLSWLRQQIEADKAAAEAADAVSPGPWVNTGQYGQGSEGDAWQIHGAPTEESGVEWSDEARDVVPAPSPVATAEHEDGGGVWKREAADHIVLQQPRATIARCEAELRVIAECERVLQEERRRDVWGGWPTPERVTFAEEILDQLASGYRHRPGYKPEWEPEGVS